MRYIFLVYHEEEKLNALPEDVLDAKMCECRAWVEELESGGHHVFSAALQSTRTAATLRNTDGRLSITDGPFAETKEILGGFTMIEAKDLNEAIQLASRFPAANLGSVEVRPVFTPDAVLAEPLDRKIAASLRRSYH